MKTHKISEAAIRRLPIYLRYIKELQIRNIQTVSSHDLGLKLDLNPAQIRKDLAYFGEFGKKGIGYNVPYLMDKIKQILKLDQFLNVALVGAGNLGHALCNYNTYLMNNMKISAVFDASADKVGEEINNLIVQPMPELAETIARQGIRIGIITVPFQEAQHVADQFVNAGIEAILNFAPTKIKVPQDIRIHNADFTTQLQSLAYYLD